jgi:hypothetical protein
MTSALHDLDPRARSLPFRADTHGHRLALRPGRHQVQRLLALTGRVDRFVFQA